MNTVGTSSQVNRPAFFPVEWPLTQNNAGNKQPTARKEGTPKPKRRKIDDTNARPQQWTAEHHTQTDKPTVKLVTSVQYENRGTSISDVKYEPTISAATPNIFKSLDHDEASWLVEEVNEANKCIFGAERAAEKFKADDDELERKKTSLNALKSLLNDLRRNIKYPDDDTAKDLDTLDEASANFGVRNMVNCLGLLDNYFSELQKKLDN
ncbi:uncharacterized protein LOC114533608 [Dendronephthya gigantea]|uniref:uncharacterized protein LOC114533608 n=1 Tax=Dendronephthya gigantea TaxID=151771 RepID=UPI00106C3DFB|nr:uncharacterized protein LOC114533608 [Dendronephthya gigantea]XP_028410967.1 uncharacterized protein LOC114533608 [Dendronephthya gigantea]XP_028410968.1 uncharacterized protein LOC114533608 [Dendronephthya gigantea]